MCKKERLDMRARKLYRGNAGIGEKTDTDIGTAVRQGQDAI
jgi:hypothetical protein